jgi:hypothetical protein
MIQPEEITRRLSALLPPAGEQFRDDLKKNFRTALTAALGRMNLVTREEFDVQQAVLLRTRQKLETLEKQLTELETQKAE